MTVELRPHGIKCNLQCRYCYQNAQREAGNHSRAYDIEAMKLSAEREGGPFILFGGEPLLLAEPELEDLWSWGFSRYGSNGVQTNGTLITENHIKLFKRYNVHVGISIDGPGELNALRWSRNLQQTEQATASTITAIERLCKEGMPPGLIVTLHRQNASSAKLPILHQWFKHLDKIGIRTVRLHALEVDNQSVLIEHALSPSENLNVFLSFAALESELARLRFDIFHDLRNLLLGEDESAACVWKACDPYTTLAVRGVEGDGQSSNCGRTNKSGIDFSKADHTGYERYLALYNTPQASGGCKGCRFFLVCKGQCPGTAIGGDWRNRTRDCDLWKGLCAHFEREIIACGKIPVSIRADRRRLEAIAVDGWNSGRNLTIANLTKLADSPYPASSSLVHVGRESVTPSHQAGLDLLPFKLPEFTRINWVSARAQEMYERRCLRVKQVWHEIEWRSVVEGFRRCAVILASPQHFIEQSVVWARYGLSALPFEIQTLTGNTYHNSRQAVKWGDPIVFRLVIGKSKDVADFRAAFDARDDREIGSLLGYPACCIDFFQTVWTQQQLCDTTWPMALMTVPQQSGRSLIEIFGNPETNILWRWMGIRAIPHLPCSFTCEHSTEFSRALTALGRRLGYREEIEWLLQFLNWPVEWTALHGVCEIRSPVFRMSTCTDATASKFTVRLHGAAYPAEGARGVHFPWNMNSRRDTALPIIY
jgi:uncharacterized protein